MRPRHEVLIATLSLTALLSVTALLVPREAATPEDELPSTFLTGPGGSRALFEATLRLGVGVRRFRDRATLLPTIADSSRRQLLVILAPIGPGAVRFTPSALSAITTFAGHADLLLAGQGASALMRCYGYRVRRAVPLGANLDTLGLIASLLDTVQVSAPGERVRPNSPWVKRKLERTFERSVVDSSRAADAERFSCLVPVGIRVDTLLISTRGDLVALRLHLPSGGRQVLLVSDEELFRNRSLRRTDAGEFALGLLVGHYDQVIFEENHLGFAPSASLTNAVWQWSKASPWGWAAWQLAAIGILALLFGIARFGPVRPAISRVRRSSLEHVRALATALSAAKGHDEAIAAIVRGLRRRLVPPGLRTRGDWRQWFAELQQHAGSPRQKELLSELRLLTQPGQSSSSVHRAANLVEDLWQQLRP